MWSQLETASDQISQGALEQEWYHKVGPTLRAALGLPCLSVIRYGLPPR